MTKASQAKEAKLPHALPALPYAHDALEPYIDKMTMEIHHGKHHNTYVTNLNKALEAHSALQSWSIDDICRKINDVPDAVRTAVRNNGGGHWNHSLFWTIMKKGGGGEPAGARWLRCDLRPRSLGVGWPLRQQLLAAGGAQAPQ